MAAKIIPDSIRDVLGYNPDTGDLFWLVDQGARKSGEIAGNTEKNGYRFVMHKRQRYRAHRVIWFLQTGEQPDEIDHINRIRDDNRAGNLRNVSRSQNMLNRSHCIGVGWTRRWDGTVFARSRYRDKVLYNGKSILLAWYHRIMAERADHPLALPSRPS